MYRSNLLSLWLVGMRQVLLCDRNIRCLQQDRNGVLRCMSSMQGQKQTPKCFWESHQAELSQLEGMLSLDGVSFLAVYHAAPDAEDAARAFKLSINFEHR